MKYENAKDVLPAELLSEVQKYVSGKLLYIPIDETRRLWGEGSGYREKIKKRNQMILNNFANGSTLAELSDLYFLSMDSVKKIVYSKKKETYKMYQPTLESAIGYVESGMVEEWILSNLLFTHKEHDIYENILTGDYIYFGVAKLPLRLMGHLEAKVVDEVKDEFARRSLDNSPLLVLYEEGIFRLLVDQDRLKILKSKKINAFPSIILVKGMEDHKRFMINYGRHLILET